MNFHWTRRFKNAIPRHMIILSIVVGLLAGFGAVGFRHLIDFLMRVWPLEEFTTAQIAQLDWYWIVGIPAAGGVSVGAITKWFAPEAKGHGVPEVMEAVALRGGKIRPRVVVAKAVASSVCIASGGSVGREGPIVQIGAAVGSTLGQIFRVQRRKLRTLVGCGAAAGIAATFNAPVAGALFAVEVLLGDFAVHQFSPIVISSVLATVVARAYLGDMPAFELTHSQLEAYRLVHPGELLAYTALGVLAGVVAIMFVRVLSFSEDVVDRGKMPLPLSAAIGGALVGCIALIYPHVLGVGYESIGDALSGSMGWQLLLALLGAKLIAVCITLASGGSGGVFAPSLFLGAMLGGVVGYAVNEFAPAASAPIGAYALVGMGSVVAATTRAPITTILIIFELTSDYRVMLPLMISTIVATQFARRFSPHSIYTVKLARRGVTIHDGQDVDVLRRIPLREVVREVDTIPPHHGVTELVRDFIAGGHRNYHVVDGQGVLRGEISVEELRPVMQHPDEVQDVVVAQDLARTDFLWVEIDDRLDVVLKQLDGAYRDELPVLDGQRFVGVVRTSDVIARYRSEIAKLDVDAIDGRSAW
ncbi:MAG: chloride channel protein [Planctomycetota bacterium]|jgi:CIC family chloride channel protein